MFTLIIGTASATARLNNYMEPSTYQKVILCTTALDTMAGITLVVLAVLSSHGTIFNPQVLLPMSVVAAVELIPTAQFLLSSFLDVCVKNVCGEKKISNEDLQKYLES